MAGEQPARLPQCAGAAGRAARTRRPPLGRWRARGHARPHPRPHHRRQRPGAGAEHRPSCGGCGCAAPAARASRRSRMRPPWCATQARCCGWRSRRTARAGPTRASSRPALPCWTGLDMRARTVLMSFQPADRRRSGRRGRVPAHGPAAGAAALARHGRRPTRPASPAPAGPRRSACTSASWIGGGGSVPAHGGLRRRRLGRQPRADASAPASRSASTPSPPTTRRWPCASGPEPPRAVFTAPPLDRPGHNRRITPLQHVASASRRAEGGRPGGG